MWLDEENRETWESIMRMSLNQVDLLNRLLDARDDARALAERRRKDLDGR